MHADRVSALTEFRGKCPLTFGHVGIRHSLISAIYGDEGRSFFPSSIRGTIFSTRYLFILTLREG